MFIFRYPKCYFGYPKYLFWISKINIPDIRNYAKKAFYLRYPKKVILDIQNNNSENKHLFRISKIVILDIRNSYF